MPSESDPEFNWHNYKDNFSDDKKAIVYAFRTELVDELIKFIYENYPPCAGNICKFNPSGSTGPEATLNSDYDLTLAGNYKISVIIQMFNSIFEHEFEKTSAEIFDTNLYGYSFLITKAGVKTNKLWSSVLTSDPNGLQGLIIDQIKSLEQDKWAYLRLKTFYEHEINRDMRSILVEVTDTVHGCDNLYTANNINTMNAKAKQNNYIKQMEQFEAQMTKTDAPSDSAKNQMIDTLSNMNYFGDETYFTQGAFVHVVGLMYFKTKTEDEKKSLFAKKYYLIHSMMENLAYFIHAFYSHDNSIIYAIKYFYRFVNALVWLQKITGSVSKELEKIDAFTDWIKSKIRNRSEEEVLSYILANKSVVSNFIKLEVPCEGEDLASLTGKIKTKLKEDIAKFVKSYTGISIAEKSSCKFYLIAGLEILMKTIQLNRETTNLEITKKSAGKFSISIK